MPVAAPSRARVSSPLSKRGNAGLEHVEHPGELGLGQAVSGAVGHAPGGHAPGGHVASEGTHVRQPADARVSQAGRLDLPVEQVISDSFTDIPSPAASSGHWRL
jgi:hypothetical protein